MTTFIVCSIEAHNNHGWKNIEVSNRSDVQWLLRIGEAKKIRE